VGFKPAAKHFPAHKTIRVIFSFISITFLICTTILNASEQNKTNIAVSDFAGKNVSAADASIVADFIRTELVKSAKYNVVDKSNMDKILAEASFQQSGCTESDCAVQLGKILNVKKIIVGTLSKLEGIYYITTNFVDVQTGKIEGSETAKCKAADELMNTSYDLADTYSARDYAGKTTVTEENSDKRKPLMGSKRLFLGIGNPYISAGYDWTRKFSTELRYAADITGNANQVKIYMLRLYYYPSPAQRFSWYVAGDFGMISFQGYDTDMINTNKGNKQGDMEGLYIGGKYNITKNINISMDIGPAWISIENGQVDGVEWILNTGINIYLF
jgi:hypothetical protein